MSAPRRMQFALTVAGEAVAGWVRRFSIREALSEGFAGEIEVETRAPPEFEEMVSRDVSFEVITGSDEPSRWFHGVVEAAAARVETAGIYTLSLSIRDRSAAARLGQNHRIFQKQSVPDIVRAVLSEAGVPLDQQRWTLRGSYAPRPYVVQFGEADMAFASRLLFDEGIAWAVWSDEGGDVLHLFDDPSASEPIVGDAVLVDRRATAGRESTVRAMRELRRGASDAVCLRDYDPQRPGADLTARDEAESSTGREVYLHPGGFSDPSVGRQRARRALERLRALTRVMEGHSDALHLTPGRWFEMREHPRAAMNAELMVISVTHEARGGDGAMAYENRFVAAPREVAFRPAEGPPKPVVGGVHTAFVTGPSAQELWGSERGEVKARFPWDESGITDDRSSTWLRVGQSPLGGPMVIPRVGFEVLVDHELGELDRPFVTGHLYNGEKMPPYELPGQSVVSSLQTATTAQGGGANEMRFDDTAGFEELFLNASRDMKVGVENDSAWSVGANQSVQVGANRSARVGADCAVEVVGDRTISVGANQSVDAGGDLGDGVGGDLTLSVGATRMVTVGGDHTEETSGSLSRSVGGLQCITGVGGYARVIGGSSQTTVGALRALICARSLGSSCGGTRVETVGAVKMVKAKTLAVSCGAAYSQQCAAQTAKVGGDRTDSAAAIVVNAGGGVKLKGTDVNITGETKVVLRVGGTSIELTPSSVTIKSPKIDLKGVKRLKSMNHKTN